MKPIKNLIIFLTLINILGCSTHSVTVNTPFNENELETLITESPHIKFLKPHTTERKTNPDDISFFYYLFHPLNEPNLIKNWEYHYKIQPASSPDWSYEKLAEVVIYLRDRDDTQASNIFRHTASTIGGEGVIDIYRKPITTKRTPAPIASHLYYGVVVRKTEN